MKLITLILTIVLIFNLAINTQAQNDPKHTIWYKTPDKLKTDNYEVEFTKIISRTAFIKMGFNIENISNDYLMYKQEDVNFELGADKFKPKEKTLFIYPQKSKKKTLQVDGSNIFHVYEFKLNIGGFYSISSNGNEVKFNNFKLPASNNTMQSGNFKIKLLKLKQETQQTQAKFECTYIGDNIGIIDQSQLSVTVEGKEDIVYANDAKNANIKLLQKGDKIKLKATFHIPGKIVDMQFAVLYIVWNKTFSESKPQKLKTQTLNFVIDEGLTNGKN